MLELHGVIPPLATPLGADGEVDRKSLRKLIHFQLAAGVHGLFVGGSTGEIALLDSEQQRAVVEVAVAEVAGAVPVLVGAVDTGTRRVIEHARAAQRSGADAVVVTAPFYVHPHPAEIVEHFRAVHAALDVPVVAYNIPSAVGARLSPDIVAELAAAKLVVALKDSGGDLAAFREFLRRVPQLPVFTGSELFADVAVQLGAAGLVPGLGNVDPHGYVRLFDASVRGDRALANDEQDRLAALYTITSIADNGRIGATAGALGAFKMALALRGIIDNARTAAPLLPLTDTEVDAIRAVLHSAGLGPID